MAKPVTKYTIFVSSPSDLSEERAALEEAVRELNQSYGNTNDCVFELLKWETHSAPGITNTSVQDIINKDIGDEYDIFLGMLWKKFGTPTKKEDSGTEEEFKRALDRFLEGNIKPQILFYFKNSVPVSLSDIDPEQFLKVQNFKRSIPKDKLLYWEFDTIASLQSFVRLHIPKRIETLIKSGLQSTDKEIEKVSENEDLGLFEYISQFEECIAISSNSLFKIENYTLKISEDFNTKTNQLTIISKTPSPNKNQVALILKQTASLINNYSSKLEIETPIFHSSFEEGIKAGISLLNIIDDFKSKETISQLEETKESVFALRRSIPSAISGLISFKENVDQLPRIQKDINSAKIKLVRQLDILIDKTNNCLELSTEYGKAINSKIDDMRIELGL